LAVEKFLFQVFEKGIIQVKLAFEGAIGHATTALQHGQSLIQNLLKGHGTPPVHTLRTECSSLLAAETHTRDADASHPITPGSA
jgi:hypothetical protein